jgi:hypothetical protein
LPLYHKSVESLATIGILNGVAPANISPAALPIAGAV